MKRVYLDNAATTPVDPRVFAAMKPFFMKKFGNPNSLHAFGKEARNAIEHTRAQVAKVINAHEKEIIFTGSATESINMALRGAAMALREKGGHVIVSAIEHHAVLETVRWMEKNGFDITFLPVDNYGLVDVGRLEGAMRKDTILVSIMTANNEIGTIEPVAQIGKLCREKDIIFHTDAVQAFGKIPLDVEKMGIDMLSTSAHKIYGPKGVGMLYIRDGIRMEPLIHGGGQEGGRRSGTENVAGIVGFGAAAEICRKEMKKEARLCKKMRDKLIKNILSIEKTRLNGHPVQRLPGNVNVSFEFIEGEALIMLLDQYGIAASTGSACSSKTLEPSHVLLAIGLPHEIAHGSLRLTVGRFNTMADVDYALKILPQAVRKLRRISPYKGRWEI